MLSQELIDGVVAFHGHHCPGLTYGMRVAEWALHEFGRAADEETVAVVETDMCAVDAIQYLLGCTFGKGNFIFLDYGKNAYSFFRRRDGKNARLMTRGDLLHDLREKKKQLSPEDVTAHDSISQQMINRIMQTDFDSLFDVGPVQISMPEKARLQQSIWCDQCGELVMATRILNNPQKTGGRNLCIPCRSVLPWS